MFDQNQDQIIIIYCDHKAGPKIETTYQRIKEQRIKGSKN